MNSDISNFTVSSMQVLKKKEQYACEIRKKKTNDILNSKRVKPKALPTNERTLALFENCTKVPLIVSQKLISENEKAEPLQIETEETTNPNVDKKQLEIEKGIDMKLSDTMDTTSDSHSSCDSTLVRSLLECLSHDDENVLQVVKFRLIRTYMLTK